MFNKWRTEPAPKQAKVYAGTKVYLGIPTHDGTVCNEIINASLSGGRTMGGITIQGGSSLTCNFNNLYSIALNNRRMGFTHFLMLHADIAIVQNGWIDRMVEIMERVQCDVLSVVMRLKSTDGKTSTAIEEPDPDNPNNPLGFRARKLFLRDCAERGKTWSDPMLLVNTGCMLVDIRKPWAEEVWFEFQDRLGSREENGIKTFFPVSLAEDYGFSRMVRRQGGKLAVTTEIVAAHVGGGRFANNEPMHALDVLPGRITAA